MLRGLRSSGEGDGAVEAEREPVVASAGCRCELSAEGEDCRSMTRAVFFNFGVFVVMKL